MTTNNTDTAIISNQENRRPYFISDFVDYVNYIHDICHDADMQLCDRREELFDKMDAHKLGLAPTTPFGEWLAYENAKTRHSWAFREHDRVCNFQTKHIAVHKIQHKKWRKHVPDICGVCLDSHKYRDIITTSCKHSFCKKCFYQWIRENVSKEQDVCCPLCRETKFAIWRYKLH
jgi:hypothetical protein